MKISVIIATRNRAYAIAGCLDSVAAAMAKVSPVEGEIIVVDNGSTDNTSQAVHTWAEGKPISLLLLKEPLPGLSRSHNRAMRSAHGEILVFTDDDCRMQEDYIEALLRHDAADSELVLRGGRVELGDQTDLPVTIYTSLIPLRWRKAENSARREYIAGKINGCNMAMRRALIDRMGFFDEDFGSGAYINSGGDTDYLFRCYVAGITLAYEPDMVVYHYHGRKKLEEIAKLVRSYSCANGALCVRYLFRHPVLCRGLYKHFKNAIKEILKGGNFGWPEMGLSAKQILAFNVQGIIKYALMKLGFRFK